MDHSTYRYAVAAILITPLLLVMLRSGMLRRAGVPVFVAGAKGNAIQRWLIAGAGIYVPYFIVRAPYPQVDEMLRTGVSPFPEPALAVMAAGVAIILIAQFGMGQSWRVGVPSNEGDIGKLVTGGVYRFSRNPTYLGIVILLIGAAAAAPGPFTIGTAIVCIGAFTVIIKAEETYLRARFGAAYEDYCRRVRRWI